MSEKNINHWTNKRFSKSETTAEKQQRYLEWEKGGGNREWEVIWEKKHDFRSNQFSAPYAEYERPAGAIIYTPHNCERPDAEETPVGTIWECHDYTKKNPNGKSKMCYDQWIIVADENGQRRWQLFRRSL